MEPLHAQLSAEKAKLTNFDQRVKKMATKLDEIEQIVYSKNEIDEFDVFKKIYARIDGVESESRM